MRTYALHLLERDQGDVWVKAMNRDHIDDNLRASLNDAALHDAVWHFIVETRRTAFMPDILASAENAQAPEDARVQALQTLVAFAPHAKKEEVPSIVAGLAKLLDAPTAKVQFQALDTIYAFRGPDSLNTLKGVLLATGKPKPLRMATLRLLAQSKSGCLLMLNMAEKGELPKDLTLRATETLNANPDEDVRLMASQLLPPPINKEGKALPPVKTLLAMTGDPARGRKVFFNEEGPQCYRCHRIGKDGKDVGPDLSKIGGKLAKDAIFESILTPSAAIAQQFEVWIVNTKSQGFLTGYLRSDSAEAIDLVDSTGNVTHIPASDIIERRKSSTSLMPDGLTAGMSGQDLVDLVAFLSTLK